MPVSLDWSPQGDRLLLGYEPGGLVALGLGSEGDGENDVLQVLPVTAVEPATAAWSPTGEEVAFVAADDQGTPGALFLVGVEPAPRSIEPLVDGSPGLAVFGLSWLPDGRSLLFSQGDASIAHATNTDLWRIGLDGEGRRLVASAGSAAPVADIDLFAPSPDGRAVAYTVVVPGDSGPAFHSLWIRDLGRAGPTRSRCPQTSTFRNCGGRAPGWCSERSTGRARRHYRAGCSRSTE
jgi:dipeptidyl aminopeptidase/acylaminoacyl peptidase